MSTNFWRNLLSKEIFRGGLILMLSTVILTSLACESDKNRGNAVSSGKITVVNAPATGTVRRVLVSEGVHLDSDAPVVEIVVENEARQAPSPEDPRARAVRGYKSAEADVEIARGEVVRYDAEVRRLTPLVNAGQSSPAELEGAQALYNNAQKKLQQTQESAKNAQTNLVSASAPVGAVSSSQASEKIIMARAPSAGTVRVIIVHVGDQVKNGQAIATASDDGH
jgi:biotin carboxyl carrier protein